ncbi:MAG: hypothetical protein C4297_00780 [Gemmataceae bacterium]
MHPAVRCARIGAITLVCLAGVVCRIGTAGQVPAAEAGSPLPEQPRSWSRAYADFLRLPPAKQMRMRQLDRALQQLDQETQTRLLAVMQRYVEWLRHLPPERRRDLEAAPSRQEKLRLIRQIKEEQWVALLPLADRERLAQAASPAERQQILVTLKRRQQEWELDFWLAESGADLHQSLHDWVTRTLMPRLTPQEKRRITDAEARPPAYWRTVQELALKYRLEIPAAVRPLPSGAIPLPNNQRLRTFLFRELPEDRRREILRMLMDPDRRTDARAELLRLYLEKHPPAKRPPKPPGKSGPSS